MNDMRIAIVIGRFNAEISNRLLEGALTRLEELGVTAKNTSVYWVPGAFRR